MNGLWGCVIVSYKWIYFVFLYEVSGKYGIVLAETAQGQESIYLHFSVINFLLERLYSVDWKYISS